MRLITAYGVRNVSSKPILSAVSNHQASTTVALHEYEKEVWVRTIHVYRAARNYFVDGIYWGDDAEGVRFYLQVTGVPPEEITKALEQVEQEGTYTVETGGAATFGKKVR
jgi:hypothetical protein